MQPSALHSFGSRLRTLRLAKDMSQAELARHVGRHQTAIGPYERDEYMPGRDVVEKLASILDSSPEYLIFGRSPHRAELPVVGRIGAGTIVDERPRDRATPTLSIREEQLVLLEIADSSMSPAFPPGHLLVAASMSEERLERFIGRPVLAQLEDGRLMLRVLLPSRDRERYDLAASASPTLTSVRVRSVRPVLGTLAPDAFSSPAAVEEKRSYG